MTKTKWTKDAAEKIKQGDQDQIDRAEMRKRANDIINAKGPELWNRLCVTMQGDIDDFNAELGQDDDPRRLRIDIDGNRLSAQRQSNYPLIQLLVECRLDLVHTLEYRYRKVDKPGQRFNESIQDATAHSTLLIAKDGSDNLYYSKDGQGGQQLQLEEVSEFLLKPVVESK